mmetsp:Transcript_80950/g.217095  ORF Transcript_80950/g.217095 Transcript_80950/m.217095 type:complete len:438 (-) Transcript_80950:179-1492(-)
MAEAAQKAKEAAKIHAMLARARAEAEAELARRELERKRQEEARQQEEARKKKLAEEMDAKRRELEQKRGTSVEVLETVVARAQRFLDGHFEADIGQPTQWEVNRCLKHGCRSMELFCNALRSRGGDGFRKMLDQAVLAWHGTGSYSSVASIASDGFDPARRRGQAYGRGEYFAFKASMSMGYAGNTKRLILSMLLMEPETSKVPDICYVVDNPRDLSMSFCLPVLIVSYADGLPPVPWVLSDATRIFDIVPKVSAPAAALPEPRRLPGPADTSFFRSPFRWHWWDNVTFQPYTEEISGIIEKGYVEHLERRGPASFVTPPVRRFLDDRPQSYRIDLSASIQEHPVTGWRRKIQRREAAVPERCAGWQVLGDDGSWRPFDPLDVAKIEPAFRAYSKGQGPSQLRGLTVVGRPELYTLCFVEGVQRNEATGTTRSVRRV